VATINKTAGFTVTWTGGNAGTDVVVGGTAGNLLAGDSGFTCRAPVEAGQLTVPGYILLGLAAGNGGINVQNSVLGTFTAPGLDQGVAQGEIAFNAPATFQ
jgi:hypothetical protein